jgi:hypothetical protein
MRKRWGLLEPVLTSSRVAALLGQRVSPVLFLCVRAVAALPASCYFPAWCSMEKHLAANGARRERRDNGIEPRSCAPAVATDQRATNRYPTPRRSSFAPVFLRQITRHTCRVNFELTHSKQRIGVITKCHTFRRSGLPISCAKMEGGRSRDIKGSQCRRRVEPGKSVTHFAPKSWLCRGRRAGEAWLHPQLFGRRRGIQLARQGGQLVLR